MTDQILDDKFSIFPQFKSWYDTIFIATLYGLCHCSPSWDFKASFQYYCYQVWYDFKWPFCCLYKRALNHLLKKVALSE